MHTIRSCCPRIHQSAIIFCLAILFGAVSAPVQAGADPELDELLTYIDGVRVGAQVPAVGLTIVSRYETLWSGALGLADIDTSRPATADTPFRIGSVTEAFTALAVLILQEQGLLDLDDRVREIAPTASFTNRWNTTHPLRVAHLLEHSAGFYDLTLEEYEYSDPTPATLGEGLAFDPGSRIARWKPGVHPSYSRSGAGLAGYIIEHLSQQAFEEFIQQRLFNPLKMRTASLSYDRSTRQRLAVGYDSDGRTVIPYRHTIMRPAEAINASPQDMVGFLKMLLNGGTFNGQWIVSSRAIERMQTPSTTLAAGSGLLFGHGLGSRTYLHNGIVFHGLGGDGDGYLARYGYLPEQGIAYFLAINAAKDAAMKRIQGLIEDYLTRDLTSLAPVAETVMSPEPADAVIGEYEAVTTRFPWMGSRYKSLDRMHIALQDETLYTTRTGGEPRVLIPVSDGHFRRAENPVATVAIVPDDEGRLIFQGQMGNYRKVTDQIFSE